MWRIREHICKTCIKRNVYLLFYVYNVYIFFFHRFPVTFIKSKQINNKLILWNSGRRTGSHVAEDASLGRDSNRDPDHYLEISISNIDDNNNNNSNNNNNNNNNNKIFSNTYQQTESDVNDLGNASIHNIFCCNSKRCLFQNKFSFYCTKNSAKWSFCEILNSNFNTSSCKASICVVSITEKLEGKRRIDRNAMDTNSTSARKTREVYWMK